MSKYLKNAALTLTLLSSATLAVRADVDPDTQQPASADVADSVDAKNGFATGSWAQNVDGSGRMMADLMAYDGTPRFVLVADMVKDVGGPEVASQSSGTLFGYLHLAGTPDPWKTTSDMLVLGTWSRSFDSGKFSLLIIDNSGQGEHVNLLGEIRGTFGTDHSLVFEPLSSDAARAGRSADAAPPSADSAPSDGSEIVAPKSGSGGVLVAPVLARWYLY